MGDALKLRRDDIAVVGALGNQILGLLQPVQPDVDFQPPALLPQVKIPARLLRLHPQGPHLPGIPLQNVAQAHKVALGRLQTAQRLRAPVAVLGNARRLFKHGPAVFTAVREHLGNLALSNQGIPVAPDAGVHEELVNVLEPHGTPCQQVFALARAVEPPRDAHLGQGRRQRPVFIVEHKRHLGHAHRLAVLRARENHVLHFSAAQRFAALLPQHPANRVNHVALAASVGADNGDQPFVEADAHLVGEGLEPVDFHQLQPHCPPPPYPKIWLLSSLFAQSA